MPPSSLKFLPTWVFKTFLLLAVVSSTLMMSGCDSSASGKKKDGAVATQTKPEVETKPSLKKPVDGPKQIKDAIANAMRLMEANDLEGAMKEAQKALIIDATNAEALFIAAQVRASKGRIDEAVQILDQIPSDSPGFLPAVGQSSEWLANAGDLASAENRLLLLLKNVPDGTQAHRLLVRIYNAQGRRWESRDHLYALIRNGDFTQEEVIMLIDLAEPFGEPKLTEAASKFSPSEVYVQLASVRSMLYKNRFADAAARLKVLVEAAPDRLEPWVWYGYSLVSLERTSELADWLKSPPRGYQGHPQYWVTRAKWAEIADNLPLAAKCYAEAIRVDPRNLAAHSGIAEVLFSLNLEEQGEQFRKRSILLAEMASLAQDTIRKSAPKDAMQRMSEGYQALGDPYLSIAWKTIDAITKQAPQATMVAIRSEIQQLGKSKPNVEGSSLLASLPMEDWNKVFAIAEIRSIESTPSIPTPSMSAVTQVRFTDCAASLGLDAPYHNGADMSKAGMLIFEGNGGGAGVIDYNMDGFVDCYFSEAGGKPATEEGHLVKRLFRNVDGLQFSQVHEKARILDFGYGHGIGVGDVDQDGFPDILVGNFGWSHLYRNNGDGTFDPWPIPEPNLDESWTSSVAIADIDGDFLPDLILAAYIAGEDCRTRICGTPGTDAKNCPPNEFPPCPDRVLMNGGDGTWRLADESLLNSLREGRTLGIVVTNLDGRNGNDVYLSNDVSANHLLVSEPSEVEGKWKLSEEGGRRGVALDAYGRAQASMGIALGDVDHNGLLDLITTNFLNDVTTLYLQSTPGRFKDGTRRARLHLYAAEFLGFGCQLADADDDGWLDLVILNGHIDDYSKIGVPYKMVPQFFHNEKGIFQWQKSPAPGEYFQQPALGRGLATLDFNNDHRIDFLATHLDRPAALLRNETSSTNRFIELELVGVQCDREAIGAIVTVTCGEEKWVTAIAAGDGYVCSNQRLLHVGIGSATIIDEIAIQWPGGGVQKVQGLPSNERFLVIQGQEAIARSH